MAEDSKAIDSFGGVIPGIYYDLIARVCAGIPFVLMLLWSQLSMFKDALGNPSLGFLLVTAAGYIVGLLLTPFSVGWSLLIGWGVRLAFRDSAANLHHGNRNDEIAAADKDAGLTITKMQAEATLCQNLLSGYLLLLVANGSGTFKVAALVGHGAGYRWVIFFGLLLAAVFRTIVYLERQNGLYRIHVSKQFHLEKADIAAGKT